MTLSSNSVLLGQYRPMNSFLHRLDARAMVLPVLSTMIFGLLTESFLFYLVIVGLLLTGLAGSGISIGTMLRNLRPVAIIVAVTFAYHIIFSARESAVLYEFFGFEITRGGLISASFFSMRLLVFLSVAFLLTLTNSPSELAEAVTRLLGPLKWLRVPVSDLGLILFIALRFIPILYDEFVAIRQAQMIRGVIFGGSIVNRIRRLSSLLVPVFVTSVGRADDLALAIEARGYKSGQPRTSYSHTVFGFKEWAFMMGSCIAVCFLYYATR